MGRTIRSAPIALALAALAVAPAALGSKAPKVYWPGCGAFDKPAYKPKKVIVTCGDGSTRVEKLRWSSWGTDGARGKGRFEVNQCQPSCSNGTIKKYSAKLRLYRPKPCAKADRREWTRLAFTFTKKHPAGYHKRNRQKLHCAD